ncbi:O-acetyl-ADP-ribose deacetylase, partial [Dysosmobacter welbionis]
KIIRIFSQRFFFLPPKPFRENFFFSVFSGAGTLGASAEVSFIHSVSMLCNLLVLDFRGGALPHTALEDVQNVFQAIPGPGIATGLQAGVNHGSRHNQQCAQDVAQVPVLPQVQQVRIHRAAQALEKRFRIQHFQQPILLHPAVAADDSGHGADLSQVLIVDFCLHVIIQIQQRLKNVAA